MSKFLNLRTRRYGDEVPIALAYVPPTRAGTPLAKLYAARDPNPILTDHIGHELMDVPAHRAELTIESTENAEGLSIVVFTD